MDEHPCPNATLYEINRVEHYTTNDGPCDTCNIVMSIFLRKQELAEVADDLI